jgi:hypothetical protein
MIAYAPRGDIERELKLLRQKFNGLALYGFDEKTPQVLSAAAKLNYRAILATIWDPRSDREIARRRSTAVFRVFHLTRGG